MLLYIRNFQFLFLYESAIQDGRRQISINICMSFQNLKTVVL